MEKKRALITGISGQDGSYLAELLIDKGYEVYGLVRRSATTNYWRIEHILDQVTLISGDVTDFASLVLALNVAKPQEVYNLAAQSFVAASWNQPILTAQITGMGVLNLLEAIRQVDKSIKYYQASSSELFGRVHEIPQKESTLLHPRSPYGVSKAFGHYMTLNYRESYGLHASAGILFNHESPRRGLEFVTRKITYAVANIAHKRQDKLELGNLDSKRDWGFAGDYVKAMWLMLQQEKADDYVVATNETHSVREFCQVAFNRVGLNYEDYVVINPEFFRPAEVDILIGDYSKAKQILGWEPSTRFDQLVGEMVDADLKRVAEKSK